MTIASGGWMRFARAAASTVAWAVAMLAGPAAAELDYPHRTIRIVVPFGPGGSTDVMARILAPELQQMLGQSVVVENRGGGSSNLGTSGVARAEPDGYTLLLTTSAFVANPALYKAVPYDPIRDFDPIADLAVAPNMLVANRDTGITSLADMIARAKAAPDALNYSSAGVGTTPHMAVELLKLKAGINLTHIAYPGGGPATQAVLSGTVQLFSGSMPNVHEHVQTGTVKALGITSKTRWPDLPDVPTFIEQGFPGLVTETIHILLAPAGTPPDIVEKLANTTLTLLERPEMRARLAKAGYMTVAGGPKALAARIAREVSLYRDLVNQTNMRLE